MAAESRCASKRVAMAPPAAAAAENRPIAAPATEMSPLPGRASIRMPAKPTATASQRRPPTISPSTSAANSVTKKAFEKLMAVASASGSSTTAEKPA